jgi:transcriptional regulator with XRE-family HTH domain
MGSNETAPINARIREIRNTLGISQAQFSRLTSLSSGYLAGIENGFRKVNERLIKLICAAFSVNESYLRYGEGEMFLDDAPDEKFRDLANIFKALPPKYQNILLVLANLLLKLKDE